MNFYIAESIMSEHDDTSVVGAGPVEYGGAAVVGTGPVAGSAPVAVVGAGPVGLAAGAQLAERGVEFVVLESGPSVASAIEEWRHVRLFSPWRYDIDAAARRLLEAAGGWTEPDLAALPTGGELIDAYLEPLTKTPQLSGRVRYNSTVTAVTRLGFDRVRTTGRETAPFLVRLADGSELLASAVVDATGTWRRPNVLGGSGIPARGETDPHVAARLVRALPDVLGRDRERFAGRRTAVVGAGHSAATTLLELGELVEQHPGTEVLWVVRGNNQARTYGGGDSDELPARGALGTRLKHLVQSGRVELVSNFRTESIELADPVAPAGQSAGTGRLVLVDGERRVVVDAVVNSTGFRPDHDMVSELRLDLDPILGSTRELAPLIDPNKHSCGTVPPHGVDQLTHPEPGYYAIGAKSYGRAPTFLLATGYEQARSVAAALAGDWEAARDVHLILPETGVCSSNLAYSPPHANPASTNATSGTTNAVGCTSADAIGQTSSDAAAGCCRPAPQTIELTTHVRQGGRSLVYLRTGSGG
ncbi:NAD(P)-binding domain-containing protein [Kribbella solani]|uniref:NAD(P)-binding domain-containing protein n=1 Tax=Kribbella solani TaxID=236067 RepID=UPI0029A4E1E2|nr:NAD(P)-binding domain-containing protein [Kribbella solani]MDX2968651.1 NAD(P)-binding domain-containing protein [Kribbella solani]